MFSRILRSSWLIVAVIGLAAAVRILNLDHWSLWEDEEGSIYFSQRIERPFPQFFPIFFLALRGVLSVTGISVVAARSLSLAIGVATLLIILLCFRRTLPREVRVLAVLFVAVNLGHVFWSQSIRYYTAILLFQLLSMHWFLDGFETDRRSSLLLSNAAFALAMLTHFSAVLLAPVFVTYLAVILWRSRSTNDGYRFRNLLVFLLPFVAILLYFSDQLLRLRAILSGYTIPSARDPVHVLSTLVAYFGVPLVILGALGLCFGRRLSPHVRLFFAIAAVVPVAELATLAKLDLINVTWYYGLFSLIGFAVLASALIVDIAGSGRQRLATTLCFATLAYFCIFLGLYHTVLYGDRPRWEEAAALLKERAGIRPGSARNPAIYGTITGLVAFYLGEDPPRTMESKLVTRLPESPPDRLPTEEQWYILESRVVPAGYLRWLADHAMLEAEYPVRFGPIERTVLVYHFQPLEGRAAAVTGSGRAAECGPIMTVSGHGRSMPD